MDIVFLQQQLESAVSDESLLIKILISSDRDEGKLDHTLFALVEKGWNRKRLYDMYDTCMCVEHNVELSEQEHDAIGNFLSILIGFCAQDIVKRFPGEPEEREEFLNFVYSDWWKD